MYNLKMDLAFRLSKHWQNWQHFDKMTPFASDGPAVGKENWIITHLKRDNDSFIHLHCLNHRIQLAVSKAFNFITIMNNTDEHLTGILKYYHYSTVRSEIINAIQNLNVRTPWLWRKLYTPVGSVKKLQSKLLESFIYQSLWTLKMLLRLAETRA